MASKAAYGSNPHAGVDMNANRDWGPYEWPFGVPASLLAVVTVPGNVKIVVRTELATLVGLMYQIAWVKYGRNFSTGWTGGYENRKIASSWATPSNHSKGRAIDNDARNNPMSTTFVCDIPPGLVGDWETLGWYWGGRYFGATDTMHFEFCDTKVSVPKYEAIARSMLVAAGSGVNPIPQRPSTPSIPTNSGKSADVTPTPKLIEEEDMAAKDLKLVRTGTDPNQWLIVDPMANTFKKVKNDTQKNFYKGAWGIEEVEGPQDPDVLAGYTEVGAGSSGN